MEIIFRYKYQHWIVLLGRRWQRTVLKSLLLLFVAIGSLITSLNAQPSCPFNRVQYHKYGWKVLHTAAFHLYYPSGYDSLASFASLQLPDIMQKVKKAMGTEPQSVPNIIIYPSVDQLYESNIGLQEKEVTTFPTINLKGNRVLLAFNGSYELFRTQLTEAWARLNWEEQFKNDAEEQLSNKKQLMPPWYKEGSIAYYASDWNIGEEALLARLYEHPPQAANWDQLTVQDARLTGKAFCYFLAQRYRDDAAKQILFQLRKGKSLARAARLVVKRNLDTLTHQCFDYFRQRAALAPAAMPADTLVSFLEKRFKGRLFALQYSPDKRKVCFVLERYNKRLAYVCDLQVLKDPKRKVGPFMRYGMPPWLADHRDDRYPLVVWEEQGRSLYLLLPDKGKLQIKQYDPQGIYRDARVLYGVDGVDALSQWHAQRWVLSAFRRGSSDIVLYDGQSLRYTALTADLADHTQLSLWKGAEPKLLYRSGYPADSLRHPDSLVKPYGLYVKKIREPLQQTALGHDQLLLADSAFIRVTAPEALPAANAYSVSHTGSGGVRRDTFGLNATVVLPPATMLTPWLKDYLSGKRKRDSIDALLADLKAKDEPSVLKSILSPGDASRSAQLQRDSIRKALAYSGKKVRPYLLQLYSAYFSAQINNDYYINRYQPFQAYLGSFKFPEVGAMVQGGFSDLFENHHFNIGYRMPAGTEGSDFFVRYENTARKLDWHVLFFRKVESLEPDADRDWKDNKGNPYPPAAKVKTHYYELGFHYPLQYDWSLDFTTAARRDRTIFLATDRYSLNYEALQSWWSINSLSLQVHKLQPTLPFLYKGFEGKVMLDGMASTGKASTILYGLQSKVAWHQPLLKGITAVLQLQGGYSGGQSRILYNFGGLDNNMVPRTDTAVHFAQQANFAFQSLVTPFRGYKQNSIYGGSFGLLNADVYFPLFNSLIPLHTGFTSLNNLQLGLFTDIAATGNTQGLPATTSPLYAFGFSARTMLAGYALRFDMAWPGTFHNSPVWYLSLKF